MNWRALDGFSFSSLAGGRVERGPGLLGLGSGITAMMQGVSDSMMMRIGGLVSGGLLQIAPPPAATRKTNPLTRPSGTTRQAQG